MNNKNVYPTFIDTQFLHLLDLRITQSGHFDHLGRIKDVYLQSVLSRTLRIKLNFGLSSIFDEYLNV